jgi:hypothetical protein
VMSGRARNARAYHLKEIAEVVESALTGRWDGSWVSHVEYVLRISAVIIMRRSYGIGVSKR